MDVVPTTQLPTPPSEGNPANNPAVRYREAELASIMDALNHSDVAGSIVAAADLLEMDRDRAKKLVTKALARTLKLPEVNGNVAAAAAKLGLNYMAAYKLLLKNNFLSATHPSRDPDAMTVEQLDAIARSAILAPDEIKEIEEVSKQERMLAAADFQTLGITDAKAQTLVSLEKFAARPISDMLNLTHGGMIYCFTELIDLFKTYKHRLDTDKLPVERDENGERIDDERDWVMTLATLCGEIRQINAQVQRSHILRLKVSEIERSSAGGGSTRRGKPGFSPMVAVQVNSNDKKTEVNIGKQ